MKTVIRRDFLGYKYGRWEYLECYSDGSSAFVWIEKRVHSKI